MEPTQTTCPAPLCALPSRCLRLCGPPGALARAQLRSGQTRTRPRPPACPPGDLSWATAERAREAPGVPSTAPGTQVSEDRRYWGLFALPRAPHFSPAALSWGPGRGPAQSLSP